MDATLVLESCPIHPSIDYLFRCKRVTLSLTLKERVMHIWLLCCCSRFCYCRSRFRSINGSYCRSCLKNELYIFAFFGVAQRFCYCRLRPNGSHCCSHLKNEVYMHVWFACCGRCNFPIVYGPKTVLTIRTNRTDRQTTVTPSLE